MDAYKLETMECRKQTKQARRLILNKTSFWISFIIGYLLLILKDLTIKLEDF